MNPQDITRGGMCETEYLSLYQQKCLAHYEHQRADNNISLIRIKKSPFSQFRADNNNIFLPLKCYGGISDGIMKELIILTFGGIR